MDLMKLSVNVPKSLNERWTQAAKRERRTKTAVLQIALEQYLERSHRQCKSTMITQENAQCVTTKQ